MTLDTFARLSAVGLYVAALLMIGMLAARRTRNMRDYFAGGKRLHFFSVAFSARATGESAWLLLGLTGFGAFVGAKGFWIVLGEVLGVGLGWLAMSRRFKRLTDRYDSITIPDYLESRFRDSGHWLRLIAAGTLVVFVPIYVSAQIHATGKAFGDFLGWNYYAGALFGFLVVLLYITRGGFIAVVWSDVFQGLFMVGGLVALPIVGIVVAGGVTPILEMLRENYPTHLSITEGKPWNAATLFSIIGLLGIGLGFLGSPQVFVRFISLKSEREINRGALVAIVWTILADGGAVVTGMIGRALLEGQLGIDGESVLPMLVDAYLPAFIAGLFIAVVLSATMSTIDSLLVVASSAAVRDYYQRVFHPNASDERLMQLSRWFTLGLAVAALGIAIVVSLVTDKGGLFWFIIFGWSGIAATFCPTIILSLFWSRMTALGAKFGMLAGFVSIPIFKFVMPNLHTIFHAEADTLIGKTAATFDDLQELAPSFAVSSIVIIVVSLLDKAGAKRVVEVDSELREVAGARDGHTESAIE